MAHEKKKIKIVCLDFDGTLVDSNSIKDNAFETILFDYPEYKDIMMNYHTNNNAIDRYQKFFYFVNNILKKKDDKLVIKLVDKFSHITDELIKNCIFVKGAKLFLEKIYKKVDIYLLSATPTSNLKKILRYKEIDHYFKETYGAPINKIEIINKLVDKHKVKHSEILYIGDTEEDLLVALETKIHFIHRQSERIVKKNQYPSFNDFESITPYFKSNFKI